ncbi:aldo/keto reductase [Microbacterium sp. zg.B48]|uniref:aldo/keto reductase n=1 Tax=Microbacterium sp. zg.B48 TaxID=2969408 RepID=UPI00214AAE2B|nr:aldo/keto reductase [Microbacterium sp. zg.B48]MCR2763049.1 aldo/keto reductase [Microbacterium sp. zg.B48]
MKYTTLGASDLPISRVILGCMSYGEPGQGAHGWSLGLEDSRPFFRDAVEAGITVFDTANVYSLGSSEEITGQLLREFTSRDRVIIATKLGMPMGPGPDDAGLSRSAIRTQVEASLRRLRTDYIDLYQIHRLDHRTPIEETMESLHELVVSGKVRAIGASSMHAWQFAKMQYTADVHGWTRFVSMQDQYNLLMREEEREMHPFCLDQGVGVIPWSPLARGRLTRDYGAHSPRLDLDATGARLYLQDEESDRAIAEAVGEIAVERGASRAQIALAWHFAEPAVSAPIIGATKLGHLHDAIGALEIELTADEVARLEAPYRSRRPEGF